MSVYQKLNDYIAMHQTAPVSVQPTYPPQPTSAIKETLKATPKCKTTTKVTTPSINTFQLKDFKTFLELTNNKEKPIQPRQLYSDNSSDDELPKPLHEINYNIMSKEPSIDIKKYLPNITPVRQLQSEFTPMNGNQKMYVYSSNVGSVHLPMNATKNKKCSGDCISMLRKIESEIGEFIKLHSSQF